MNKVILIGFCIYMTQSIAFAYDQCRPRKLRKGDKIITLNQKNPLGTVVKVHHSGFVKIKGIPWPRNKFYNPAGFCLYQPVDTLDKFQKGDEIFIISDASKHAESNEITDFSSNGFVGIKDWAGRTEYMSIKDWVYDIKKKEHINEYDDFKVGECVIEKSELGDEDSIPDDRPKSYQIEKISVDGYLLTDAPYTGNNYWHHSDYVIDESESCKSFWEKEITFFDRLFPPKPLSLDIAIDDSSRQELRFVGHQYIPNEKPKAAPKVINH